MGATTLSSDNVFFSDFLQLGRKFHVIIFFLKMPIPINISSSLPCLALWFGPPGTVIELLNHIVPIFVPLLMPQLWGHSRPGWMGLWATWCSCRCPCSLQRSWSGWSLMVPSNSNNSMILWICRSQKGQENNKSLIHGWAVLQHLCSL